MEQLDTEVEEQWRVAEKAQTSLASAGNSNLNLKPKNFLSGPGRRGLFVKQLLYAAQALGYVAGDLSSSFNDL